MAPATRSNNNSNSTKPDVASSTTSKSIVKNSLTNKPIKLTSPSTVKDMILESGLSADASFVVPPKPAIVSPNKENLEGMDLIESGVPVDPVDAPVASPLRGEAPSSDFDEDLMANLVGAPNFNPDDEEGGDAGGKEGIGTKNAIDVDLDDKDGGDEGTGAGKDGAEAGSGVMDATGSLIAPTNNKDKDDMSVNDADTEAAKNTQANTTGIKSISLLNAKGVAYIWSQADCIPRTVVSSSVASIIWRKVKQLEPVIYWVLGSTRILLTGLTS